MIYNQWYPVLESKEVKKGKLVGVTRFGEKLVFGRKNNGEVICLRDKCCHRGAALSAGKLVYDRIKCPFHGFEYDETGHCQLIPAIGRNALVPPRFKVDSYVIEEQDDFIWVWYGAPTEKKQSIPFFDELKDFKYKTFKDRWSVHYSRAIENILDVVHLPFVHSNTIGRGNKTLVDGPKTVLEDNEIRVWLSNRVDDGSAPLKVNELPDTDIDPIIKFRYPNLWTLNPSPKLKIFVASVPIDEENTVLYVRFYQKIVKIPVFSHIFNLIGYIGSKIILKQDKRVVLTQTPKKSSYKMDENLIQGDFPIVLYRRRRQELIDSNPKNKKN